MRFKRILSREDKFEMRPQLQAFILTTSGDRHLMPRLTLDGSRPFLRAAHSVAKANDQPKNEKYNV